MSKKTDLEARIKRLASKGLEVVEDDRPWTEKAAEVKAIDDETKGLLVEHADIVEYETRRASFKGLTEAGDDHSENTTNEPDPKPAATKSLGEQFMESDGAKNISSGSKFSTGAVDVKATFTEGAGAAGVLFPQYLAQPVPILLRRLTIANLIPGGALSGASLIYPKESAITNAAAATAEGGLKPASDLNLVQVTETLTKISTTLKVSDETMQDYPAAVSYVNGRLGIFVLLAEEDELLNGSGSTPHMTGILNRSGLTAAQALGGDTAVDAIYKEITKIRTTAFIEPDGLVINPANWQTIRLAKDSQGQYYGGGPFTGAYGTGTPSTDSLWGLPAVITPAIAAGTALVGSFGMCAQVFRKDGLRIEATNSNEDDFLHNLVAIRAELRELLAVYRPAGFGKVTGLA